MIQMTIYNIPIYFEPFIKQKKAARLLHLLAGFLMIANAWGDFKQPTPNLFFVVIQIAGSLLTLVFALSGKKGFPVTKNTNALFRVLEAAVLLFAAWYFFNTMNLHLMGMLQVLGAVGLLLLFFTEQKLYAPCFVTINEKGIITPNNFKNRIISWADVDNMLVKNDFISINTKQNHFIQYETAEVLSELQMDEMNAFCREHFAK